MADGILNAGDQLARRNALFLAMATALAGANSTVIFATGAIVGAGIAPSPALATLPISIFVVGMAMATLPIGWIARTFGRRAAFMAGASAGIITGVLACYAVLTAAFPLFCLATFFGGFYQAASQSYRFAAADSASESFRPKAIAWVLVGGIFAGVIGPQLVTHTMDMWPPYLFAASYLFQSRDRIPCDRDVCAEFHYRFVDCAVWLGSGYFGRHGAHCLGGHCWTDGYDGSPFLGQYDSLGPWMEFRLHRRVGARYRDPSPL